MVQGIVKALKGIGKDERGFTLMELIAVLAVLAVLTMIAVPKFTGTVESAKEKADKATLEVLQRAVDMYVLDHEGDGPDKEEDLLDGYIKGGWPEAQVEGKAFRLADGEVKYNGNGNDNGNDDGDGD